MGHKVPDVLVGVEHKDLYPRSSAARLSHRISLVVSPHEFQSVVITPHVACGETICSSILHIHSPKECRRKVEPTIQLSADEGRKLDVLAGGRCCAQHHAESQPWLSPAHLVPADTDCCCQLRI